MVVCYDSPSSLTHQVKRLQGKLWELDVGSLEFVGPRMLLSDSCCEKSRRQSKPAGQRERGLSLQQKAHKLPLQQGCVFPAGSLEAACLSWKRSLTLDIFNTTTHLKGHFPFQSQRRAALKNVLTTRQFHSFSMLIRLCSKSFKVSCSST